MTVRRSHPLPEASARGRLIVASSVIDPTRAALEASSGKHLRHEGLALWLGRSLTSATHNRTTTIVTSVISPPTAANGQSVFINEHTFGAAIDAAREYGLGIVAQVHSHPGHDTRHSDGDDRLIVMPFEGMFSLVIADFGRGSFHVEDGAGLHQFQDGQWVRIIDPDILTLAPAHVSMVGHDH
jgi:proteasome lid subunit RPN8/RPN11